MQLPGRAIRARVGLAFRGYEQFSAISPVVRADAGVRRRHRADGLDADRRLRRALVRPRGLMPAAVPSGWPRCRRSTALAACDKTAQIVWSAASGRQAARAVDRARLDAASRRARRARAELAQTAPCVLDDRPGGVCAAVAWFFVHAKLPGSSSRRIRRSQRSRRRQDPRQFRAARAAWQRRCNGAVMR